jgi:dUTP pyrophosphatase
MNNILNNILNTIQNTIQKKIINPLYNYYYSINYYNIELQRLTSDAYVPRKGSEYSAGYDLYSPIDEQIESGERKLIKLNISISIPRHYYGRIAPRSGLSLKGIDIGGGVVDSDYTGNVGVIIINNSPNVFTIEKGNRIAQLIIEKVANSNLVIVNSLQDTERSSNGFGSTGI